MYNSFFGLDRDPFRVNPDPSFLYLSEGHREALATLIYAVQQRKGFLVLSGEVGTGKTTMLNAMLQKLDAGVQTAYLFNTKLTTEDFFAYVLDELGLEPVEPFRKSGALRVLNQHLIDRLRKGQQTLLIVDEAQNLSSELLEEIRMLSNLETPQSKLVQIILVGQPELAQKLEMPELRQLRQRVELRHAIRALTERETADYVRERLLIAGHERGDIFAGAALRAVHEYSRGIPRVINVLCDNSLIAGYAKQSQRVSAQMVREQAQEMGLLEAAGTEAAAAPEGASPKAGGAEAPPFKRRRGWLRRLWSQRTAARSGA